MSYHINLIGQEERAAVASQVGSDRRKESLSKFGMEAQYMTTSKVIFAQIQLHHPAFIIQGKTVPFGQWAR